MVMRGHLDLQLLTDLGLNDKAQAGREELNNLGDNTVKKIKHNWQKSTRRVKASAASVAPLSLIEGSSFESFKSFDLKGLNGGALRRHASSLVTEEQKEELNEQSETVQDGGIKLLPPMVPKANLLKVPSIKEVAARLKNDPKYKKTKFNFFMSLQTI